MVDTDKLNELIFKSGLKKRYIAEQLGISEVSLWSKSNNKTKFTGVEVDTLCKLLNVNNLNQQRAIFFTTEHGK